MCRAAHKSSIAFLFCVSFLNAHHLPQAWFDKNDSPTFKTSFLCYERAARGGRADAAVFARNSRPLDYRGRGNRQRRSGASFASCAGSRFFGFQSMVMCARAPLNPRLALSCLVLSCSCAVRSDRRGGALSLCTATPRPGCRWGRATQRCGHTTSLLMSSSLQTCLVFVPSLSW